MSVKCTGSHESEESANHLPKAHSHVPDLIPSEQSWHGILLCLRWDSLDALGKWVNLGSGHDRLVYQLKP